MVINITKILTKVLFYKKAALFKTIITFFVIHVHKPFVCRNKQELSYRKQIARQQCTQYVEDIYRPNYP